MSRTYHHSKKYWKGRKAVLNRYIGWIKREPKEWRKIHKHKARRAVTRHALFRAAQEPESTVFPLDKKPWIYYW